MSGDVVPLSSKRVRSSLVLHYFGNRTWKVCIQLCVLCNHYTFDHNHGWVTIICPFQCCPIAKVREICKVLKSHAMRTKKTCAQSEFILPFLMRDATKLICSHVTAQRRVLLMLLSSSWFYETEVSMTTHIREKLREKLLLFKWTQSVVIMVAWTNLRF